MTQISCEVTPPKQARPSEGILFVNVELSPMAAPQFEPGRYVHLRFDDTVNVIGFISFILV